MLYFFFFFFNDTATTEIYTLSLHDALPICQLRDQPVDGRHPDRRPRPRGPAVGDPAPGLPRARTRGAAHRPRARSEEHTSELQSRQYLVCRLLLEKKKQHTISFSLLHQVRK